MSDWPGGLYYQLGDLLLEFGRVLFFVLSCHLILPFPVRILLDLLSGNLGHFRLGFLIRIRCGRDVESKATARQEVPNPRAWQPIALDSPGGHKSRTAG